MAQIGPIPKRNPRPHRSSREGPVRFLHWAAALLLAACTLAATSQATAQESPTTSRWVTTWGTSPSSPGFFGQAAPSFENRTLRQIVHTSVGGDRVRVELSNRHGEMPLHAHFSPEGEQKSLAVNEWIRTSGAYDAVLDFEAATRDPSQPSRFRGDFSTDNLHPNDAGYKAMAEAIDLKLFDLE